MTDPTPAPPADVVPVLPAGVVSFGMQLPIQSQSTIYVEPWEAGAGPDELARVALACEAAGFFYVGVCDHTFIPERLAGAMSTVWYDTVATLGWLAAVTSRDPPALPHLRGRPPAPAAGRQGVRHPRRAVRRPGDLRRGRRPRHRGVRPHGARLRRAGPGHRRGRVRAGPRADRGVPRRCPGRAGRPRGSASSPDRCASPRPPIWVGGSSPAALRRTARFADGWLPQSVGPNVELLATLRELRAEYRDGAPLDIGSIAYPMYLGTPPAGNELPPGTVQGTRRRAGRAPAPLPRGRLRPGPGAVPGPLGRGAVRPDRRLRRRGRPARQRLRRHAVARRAAPARVSRPTRGTR